jgi:hypothetical protein
MIAAFSAFLAAPEGIAFWTLFVIMGADFLLSTFRALSTGTFQLSLVGSFIRVHLWGRVAPLATLLLAGYFLAVPALTAIAVAAGALYIAETIGSIRESFATDKPDLPKE